MCKWGRVNGDVPEIAHKLSENVQKEARPLAARPPDIDKESIRLNLQKYYDEFERIK